MKKFIIITIVALFSLTVSAQQTVVPSKAHVDGRNVLGSLPIPSYTSKTEGIVVVQIKVNQYGEVTEAIAGAEGTTVTDKTLWTAARNAALKAHFNQSANAPAIQLGTITYSFRTSSDSETSIGNSTIQGEITPIKDLVDAQGHGLYSIRAKYVKTHKLNKLIFLVEEDDYIIPIQLVKNDLGAEKRFQSLNLQAGDSLTIRGTLSKIDIDLEDYTGLVDAIIVNIKKTDIYSDSPSVLESETIPFQLIEVKPSFNGGDANEFSKWVNSQLVYPDSAKKNGIQGRVTLQFIIKADGSVTDVRVLNGVDSDLDKEAVRVVSKSPKWKPGTSKGKPIDVTYTFPVIFQLR